MTQNFVNVVFKSKPLLRISIQHFRNKVLCFFRDGNFVAESEIGLSDQLEH